MTTVDMGEGGPKCLKIVDVICERSLMSVREFIYLRTSAPNFPGEKLTGEKLSGEKMSWVRN